MTYIGPLDMVSIQLIHESFMIDTVEVKRYAKERVMNPDSGEYEELPPTLVYGGLALVANTGTAYPEYIGGEENASATYEVQLPIDSDPAQPYDLCQVIDSVWNPWMNGMILRVVDRIENTYASAQRFTAMLERRAT